MKTVGVAVARQQLLGLLREAERGETILILRRGREAAVLLSARTFRELQRMAAYLETLEISRRLAARGLDLDPVELARAARAELEARP